MKVISILVFISLLYLTPSIAQQKYLKKIADSIESEGKALFRSEWASWYGSDIFSEKCKARRAIAGGYISYDDGHQLINIFFSKGADPAVLSTISFGYDRNSKNYILDTTDREFSAKEKELYIIRQAALSELNHDTIFKVYRNASLNLVPLIDKGTKRVYILTGPQITGVVLFGNDYLIDFDKDDHVVSKKKLHKGLIVAKYSKASSDTSKIELGNIHTHLPEYSEFMTSTDICTLMLYERFTTWNQDIVVSKNYASIWNCKTDELTIKTFEDYQKSDQLKNLLENNSH